MRIEIDRQSVADMKKLFTNLGKNAKKEFHIAVRNTSKRVRVQTAKELRKVLNVPSSILKKTTKIGRKATVDDPTEAIILIPGHPIPLKYFDAKQLKTKKLDIKRNRGAGVTYKIWRGIGSRSINRDAFILNRYKGHVFRRAGRQRGPLIRIDGPAPGEAYEKAGVAKVAVATANEALPKELKRRIQFLLHKASQR